MIVNSELEMLWEKAEWHYSWYCPVFLSRGSKRNQEGLSDRMSWSADQDLNPGSPEYETEILQLLLFWVRTHFNLHCRGALTISALTSGILVTPSC